MKDRVWVEAKLAELRADNDKRLADYNATRGAIQTLELLLAEDEQEHGIPVERLFPGAVVTTTKPPYTVVSHEEHTMAALGD